MLTITAVAEIKKISLDDVVVNVNELDDEPQVGQTSFTVGIELSGNLTQRETILLYNSARNCDVHKLLSSQLSFNNYFVKKDE